MVLYRREKTLLQINFESFDIRSYLLEQVDRLLSPERGEGGLSFLLAEH
jgi:hypothetical protein